jgi:hypothetical protein
VGAVHICNLYSITTNQAASIALFRVVNRYIGNLAPMPGVFPRCSGPSKTWLKSKNPESAAVRREREEEWR